MCRLIILLFILGGCLCILTVSDAVALYWKLPTANQIQQSLDSCHNLAEGNNPAALRCLVKDLGLWTDELGYNAKRIAKIFASHNQIEELMFVVNYCNRREQRIEEPDEWAYEAYKCATSGRFGHWVNEYMNPETNAK